MPVLDEDCQRHRGHKLDKAVLKYLREMIRICRYQNRRWLRMEYERAWEFAAITIYGPLPQPEDSSTGQHPDSVASQLPAGSSTTIRNTTWPLRKIVKRFRRPYQTWQIDYETLECLHILRAPTGYSVPARSRRCPHCAAEKVQASAQKKRPARAAEVAKAKAVGA